MSDPGVAAMHRRAAALFLHWRETDRNRQIGIEGVCAVMAEVSGDDRDGLVYALLDVGWQLAKAAKDGAEDDYLAHVVREASADEHEVRNV